MYKGISQTKTTSRGGGRKGVSGSGSEKDIPASGNNSETSKWYGLKIFSPLPDSYFETLNPPVCCHLEMQLVGGNED